MSCFMPRCLNKWTFGSPSDDGVDKQERRSSPSSSRCFHMSPTFLLVLGPWKQFKQLWPLLAWFSRWLPAGSVPSIQLSGHCLGKESRADSFRGDLLMSAPMPDLLHACQLEVGIVLDQFDHSMVTHDSPLVQDCDPMIAEATMQHPL
jgi:hypothetical protein